jgi:hypothetical protein
LTAVYVRHIGLLSAARFGFVTGAVTATPMGVVLAFVIRAILGWLRRTMEGWQNASIDVPLAGKIPVNLIELLKLSDALATVRKLDNLPWIVVAAVFVAVVLVMGLLSAAFTSWQAFAYNSMAALSGGLEVTLESGRNTKMVVMRRNAN